MTLKIFKTNPPPGFELGEPPTDTGVSQPAYLFREPNPGEATAYNGKVLVCMLYRGLGALYRRDGSVTAVTPAVYGPTGKELIALLKEAAEDGFMIEEY